MWRKRKGNEKAIWNVKKKKEEKNERGKCSECMKVTK